MAAIKIWAGIHRTSFKGRGALTKKYTLMIE